MDITNKAIEVSNRMQEIEYRLACLDLTVRDAEDLCCEYAELEEWNHCLNAYFKIRAENEKLNAQIELLRNAAQPLVSNYNNWAAISEPDFTCDHSAKVHRLFAELESALKQTAKET